MLNRFAVSLIAALTALTVATDASAADAPSTMVVIDGSGSMWGRFDTDKRAKIDIIRELVKAKVATAGTTKIGLTSFGHRRKGDCSDVEVIAAASDARDLVIAALDKLSPRGKGPLAVALREAAASLGASRPASLIVIGDGADNCQQDTCAVAEEIAKSSPGVAVHMISIGVETLDMPRLACVAKATGGTFTDVKDATALATAIEAATKLAMLTPGAPAAAARTLPAALPAGASLRVSAALAQGGAPLSRPITWQIFKKDATELLGRSEGQDFTATLDPGSYDVVAEIGRISARQSITIESGRPLGVILPLNAARLNVRAVASKTSETSPQAVITVIPAAQQDAGQHLISRAGTFDDIVAPGTYTVRVADGLVRQSKAVTLNAGSDTTLDIVLGTGRLEVTAALREDGGAIEDVAFTISEDDPDSPDGRREVARSRAAAADFTLPAGTYYVTARAGASEVRSRIAVGAGDSVKRVLVLPLTPLKVSALIAGQSVVAGQGLVIRITALDGDRGEVVRSVMPETDVLLAPGRYRAAVHLAAQHITATQDITLEAGKRAEVVLKIDAAEVALKPAASLSALKGDTFWEIIDAKGQPVWRTTVVEPKVLLAPGRYTVKLESRDKRTEAAFEVRSGERRQIEVGAQ